MKRRLVLLASLAALACARADLVIEQKIEGADQTASLSTLKMKGAKLRVDVRNAAGAVSAIIDLETGESLTLLHSEKLALKRSAAETKETIDAMRKRAGAGGNLEPTKTVAMGRKEKVGEWNADVFTTKGGAGPRTLWVTSDLPNWAKVKEQFDKIGKLPVAIPKKGVAPEAPPPGVVVKTEIEAAGKTFTSTIVSVEEEDLDAALFAAPEDYRETTK